MKKLYLFAVVFLFWQQGFSQSTDQNYIRTRTYIKTGSDYMDQIDYFDGLGRPSQTIQVGASPVNGADLVSHTQYDNVGRIWKNWLPLPVGGNAGQFVGESTFIGNATSSYGDANPYAETNYESSPLNRITDQYGPGASWYSNNKRGITAYDTNDNTITYFYVLNNLYLRRGNNYAAGTLYKTTVSDEDGKTVTEFKDKLGRVIMKRSAGDVDTYYVYNDLGQLSFVLPPLAADGLKHYPTSSIISLSNDFFVKYAYLYQYDDRGNQTYKRLPGCNPVYMGYDRANRLVLSQDGNQRLKNQWTIYKYDLLGRLLYTSEGLFSYTYEQCRDALKNMVVTETFSLGNHTYPVFDTGYSKNYYHLRSTKLYMVNYYDDYQFLEKLPSSVKTNLIYDSGKENVYGVKHPSVKGLLTGTRTYLLDGSGNYTTTAYYYDYKGQVIQNRSSNHMGGYDLVYNQYDFTGNTTQNLKEHNISGQEPITELYIYTYDHALRLKTTTYKLNNNAPVLLSSNTYDDFGRLTEKKRHNNTDTEEFEYNIRGWKTKIKSGTTFEQNLYYNTALPDNLSPQLCYNGNISAYTWKYNNTLNGYRCYYDQMNRLTEAISIRHNQCNGCYLEAFWYDKHGNITYLFRTDYEGRFFDDLEFSYAGNQMYKIFDYGGSINQYGLKEYQDMADIPTEFTYDKNGNMLTDFDRNIVAIRYNLLNLPDTIQFGDGNQIVNKYDAGGRKLRTWYYTVYNHTIQPIVAQNTIKDVLLNNEVYVSGTDYIGNVEYSKDSYYLEGEQDWDACYFFRLNNPEGYIHWLNNSLYLYYRKDHLGNNREVWRAPWNSGGYNYPGTTYQFTQYYPSGLPWKYNYGDEPEMQPYKYGGKEFVEMHGLDEYDSDARWYYPAIMRTTTMDPLAEKYYDISPYAWCGNNPVRFVDPDGRDWYSHEEEYVDSNGNKQMRTSYKYVEGQMSKDDMKKGNFTHLGLTYTEGNDYYSLFGSKQDLKTEKGLLYKKVDEAIINYAEAIIENINRKPNGPFDSEDHTSTGKTDFTINKISGKRNFSYEGSYWGVYFNFTGNRMNTANIENWLGDSNMPMDIGDYGQSSQNRKPSYHIRFQNNRRGDPVHLKYNRSEALILLRKFNNLFPQLKKK